MRANDFDRWRHNPVWQNRAIPTVPVEVISTARAVGLYHCGPVARDRYREYGNRGSRHAPCGRALGAGRLRVRRRF